MNHQSTFHRPGILIVDDETVAPVRLDQGLRREGFAVWQAGDGWEARELYRRHQGHIDLVLLAVHLPGLDGPQTLATLRQIDPHLRCCFLSGHAGAYTDAELLEQGATAILNKPFRADEIAPILLRLLGRSHPGPHQRESCPSVLSWRVWGRDDPAPSFPQRTGFPVPSQGCLPPLGEWRARETSYVIDWKW